jgi:hypothetical protein
MDLSRKDASLSTDLNTKELMALTPNLQKIAFKNVVHEYVCAHIESCLAGHIDLVPCSEEFFHFCEENNPDLLMPQGVFSTAMSSQDKLHLLVKAQEKKRWVFMYVYLKFFAVKQRLRQVIVLVDDCDQKDPYLIEAFVNVLAHLDRCFESLVASMDEPPKLAVIVSCRPITRQWLEQNKQFNELGSHGYKVLTISAPCSIASVVSNRVASDLDGNKAMGNVSFTSRNGILWSFDRSAKFVEKLCESMDKYGHAVRLARVCNYNMADCLTAITEVVSNRHFLDLDRVIGDVVLTDQKDEHGLSWALIANCLAFVNAPETPLYPKCNTRIPNLLMPRTGVGHESFVKPRLIQLIIERHEKRAQGSSVKMLCGLGSRLFVSHAAAIIAVLDELQDEGLCDTHRRLRPSDMPPDEELTPTPRAKLLWESLKQSGVLLKCYRDDLFLDQRHRWQRTPTFNLSLEQLAQELFWICQEQLEREYKWLVRLRLANLYREFSNYYGSSFVAELLMRGLKVDFQEFYGPRVKNWAALGLDKRLGELLTLCGKCKANMESITAPWAPLDEVAS